MNRSAWIGLIAITLVLLLSTPCWSAKLYSYTDGSGSKTYTDKPLSGRTPTDVRQIQPRDYRLPVRVDNTGSRSRPVMTAWNDALGPVEIRVSARSLINARTVPSLPRSVVVAGSGRRELFRVYPRDVGRSWRFGYRIEAVIGDPKAYHQPTEPYLPPFEPGGRFPITQAYPGDKTHNHVQSRYAVDIAMPEGTPVCAARGGKVIEVAQDFVDGGTDQRYGSRANFIRILHDDGTMGVYAHLLLESVRVLPGGKVKAGDVIARSGNTGYSSGPHLHFVVQKNAGMELISIPFKFTDGPPIEGTWLTR